MRRQVPAPQQTQPDGAAIPWGSGRILSGGDGSAGGASGGNSSTGGGSSTGSSTGGGVSSGPSSNNPSSTQRTPATGSSSGSTPVESSSSEEPLTTVVTVPASSQSTTNSRLLPGGVSTSGVSPNGNRNATSNTQDSQGAALRGTQSTGTVASAALVLAAAAGWIFL